MDCNIGFSIINKIFYSAVLIGLGAEISGSASHISCFI